MPLRLFEVTTRSDLNDFINFPWWLYRHDAHWVPPLKMSVRSILSPKHPFYKNAHRKLFIVRDGDTVVGRIASILDQDHLTKYNELALHFGFFECVNDETVARMLFNAVEAEAKRLKMDVIRGPFSPSTNYECGLLIQGFTDPPQIMMSYNPRYYLELIEQMNFHKAMDLIAYNIPIGTTIPERFQRIYERIKNNSRIVCRNLDKKNWKSEVEKIFSIYNSAWEENWGHTPMSWSEFRHMTNEMKMILNPDLAIMLEYDGEAVGIMIALPDYNQIFKTIKNGRLLPKGIFKLLRGAKKINRFRVLLMGVKKEYRKLGLSSVLYAKIWELTSQMKDQYKEAELSWILETNDAMNTPILQMGANPYKKYRIFEKKVSKKT